MTDERKAQSLYREYMETCGLLGYSQARRRGYIRRVLNLSTRLDPQDTNDQKALIYLDIVAIRGGFDLRI